MKIIIEIDEKIDENVLLIKCKELDEKVLTIKNTIIEQLALKEQIKAYQQDIEYYLNVEDILFFETSDKLVYAHTNDKMFLVKEKLFELEDKLPNYFCRISKSAIININQIYSIKKNISASSLVQFRKSHKKVYVSRFYFKSLKMKLDEKR